MSVPGRIGITLIIALAIVDALILASGARSAATAIQTRALVESVPARTAPVLTQPATHDQLLSTAIHQINLWVGRHADKPAGV